jgi:hypothetical protein
MFFFKWFFKYIKKIKKKIIFNISILKQSRNIKKNNKIFQNSPIQPRHPLHQSPAQQEKEREKQVTNKTHMSQLHN